MAKTSAKKTIISNSRIMNNLIITMSLSSLLYFVICIVYKSVIYFMLGSFPEWLVFLYLYKISRPNYKSGKISSGFDLSSRGLISTSFDFFYMSIFIKFLRLWTAYAYLLYFTITISLVYEFYWRFKIRKTQ